MSHNTEESEIEIRKLTLNLYCLLFRKKICFSANGSLSYWMASVWVSEKSWNTYFRFPATSFRPDGGRRIRTGL